MSGLLMGEEKLKQWAETILGDIKADQAEVGITVGKTALTRFANSTIHQNMDGWDVRLRLRAVFGRKVATLTTNVVDGDGVSRSIDAVVRMARAQDENKEFVSLPTPDEGGQPGVGIYREATAADTPESRAGIARAVIAEAGKLGCEAAGSMGTSVYERCVVNSLGVRSYYRSTSARLIDVVSGPDGGFGYAGAYSSDVTDIDGAAVGREGAERGHASRNPISIEPGDYECVLLPYAMEDVLNGFRWMAFDGQALQEGRSCLSGKLGEKIASDSISIWDDGHDPRTIATPFDSEGVPKQRVDLITKGVASAVLYDSYSAHREGKKSTGHAGGSNLLVGPGDATVDEMIASTKRGLLVTRFHYTNVAHLMTATLTGMTRDGTFLIENGRITGPVKNMRFTQSLIEAFSGVEMVGRDLQLVENVLTPAIKVNKFRFSSATEF